MTDGPKLRDVDGSILGAGGTRIVQLSPVEAVFHADNQALIMATRDLVEEVKQIRQLASNAIIEYVRILAGQEVKKP